MADLLGDYQKGVIFIVSAPAGTGKTTLVKRLSQEFPSIATSISYTTRLPRGNEKTGIDYHFISLAHFEEKIAKGDFLEYVKLYDTYYGTSKESVDKELEKRKHLFLVIDTQGALKLKPSLDAVYIFIQPPSIEALKTRLIGRQTESESVIENRLKWARQELEAACQYDYRVVNDDIEIAYQVLRSIFIAECHRVPKNVKNFD